VILPTKYFFHTSQGSLTCHKILRHGTDGFTSPPKEVVLQIFIVLDLYEPVNLGPKCIVFVTEKSPVNKLKR
jgi:hypothetical protein